jgi:hypothetical protein
MELIQGLVLTFLIYIVIDLFWSVGEILLYGKVTPRRIDDVVAVILAISLYFNMR